MKSMFDGNNMGNFSCPNGKSFQRGLEFEASRCLRRRRHRRRRHRRRRRRHRPVACRRGVGCHRRVIAIHRRRPSAAL